MGCFSTLIKTYSCQIDFFIRLLINHISKADFCKALKEDYIRSITIAKCQSRIGGAGFILFNPNAVLSKLDVRLHTLTSKLFPIDPAFWSSQTPHNSTKVPLLSLMVIIIIERLQLGFPPSISNAINALTNGEKLFATKLILAQAESRDLWAANQALSRRRKANKTRIGDSLDLVC